MRRLLAFWPLGLLPLVVVLALDVRLGSVVDLKIVQAQQDLRALNLAVHAYKTEHGDFPSDSEGLAALGGAGGPLAHLPKDPWGNSYLYRRSAEIGLYVYSPGVDHIDDDGSGDDVILGPKKYRCADYGLNCGPTPLRLVTWVAAVLAAMSLGVGIAKAGSALARLARPPNNRWRGP